MSLRSIDPRSGQPFGPPIPESDLLACIEAASAAEEAFVAMASFDGAARAGLLEAIADEVEALGEELIALCGRETGLTAARLTGERGRTVGQLRAFAARLREGSWVEAIIDRGEPSRSPSPRPELRRMLRPLGPVAVFGASNFPLAFAVVGGDTAAALAAGCPVVFKGHPFHPATSAMLAGAMAAALRRCGFPAGAFALLQSRAHELGAALVRHRAIKAVSFTGSLRGGRALCDVAAARPEPIPVYAEMGSTNPVFLLPGRLAQAPEALGERLAGSLCLGTGQFCTNPGLVFVVDGPDAEAFLASYGAALAALPPAPMVHPQILVGYRARLENLRRRAGVELIAEGPRGEGPCDVSGTILAASAEAFIDDESLREEVFGPCALVVRCRDLAELRRAAARLPGQLTAAVHGTEAELASEAELLRVLERRVGRLIFDGVPTGVEVAAAMVHGGPYPASSDGRSTSVGVEAIPRFSRPVCFQDAPQALLPAELQDANPLGLWRRVDGVLTRDHV